MNLHYAAGFFDGEGCVHIARNVRVVISGCFKPGLLDKFAARWGGRVVLARWSDASRSRPGVRWEITGQKAAAFLTDVLPYLVERRDQARLALKLHVIKRRLNVRGGKGYTQAQRDVFASISKEVRRLKKIHHDYGL